MKKPKRAPTDKERLDFIQRGEAWINAPYWMYRSWDCWMKNGDIFRKSSVRRAIDAAIRASRRAKSAGRKR